MKKLFLLIVFAFAFLNLTKANVAADSIPIIMTPIIDNPIDDHGTPPKSPEATLMIYQSGNSFYFGETLVGCTVTLLLNSAVIYSDFVGTDGTVTIPASFTGTFELCITIGTQVFSAEIEL